MFLKRIFLLAIFVCMTFAFSISAYAMPEEGDSDFLDVFEINPDELMDNAQEGKVGLYILSKDGTSVLQDEDKDINDYGVFNLNKGFSRLTIVTFADSKMFSGKGEVDTVVGVMVFNAKDKSMVSYSESIDTIGASGIYNASISLRTGDNSVVLAVKKGDLLIYRLFKVTVKQEETKGILENIQINFMPGKGTVEQKPSGLPFTVYNLPSSSTK